MTVSLHSHGDFEGFYILGGAYEVLIGSEWRDARAGDYVRVPAGVPHALCNVSAEPAVDLIITAPRVSAFFREVGRPIGSPPPTGQDLANFGETASRYGYWLASPEENAAVGITASILFA
ncbi:cupin domain-containing protein [Mycobacterium palustre]|uniref:cupin domain-containing protein n=1 Tax=Mycobacterium palustre TaxID=153971 RepID=UPI001FED00CA|nr:cupin domain-containing protein [Mycobacterium palustre]